MQIIIIMNISFFPLEPGLSMEDNVPSKLSWILNQISTWYNSVIGTKLIAKKARQERGKPQELGQFAGR